VGWLQGRYDALDAGAELKGLSASASVAGT
jgi:hypothetical protein